MPRAGRGGTPGSRSARVGRGSGPRRRAYRRSRRERAACGRVVTQDAERSLRNDLELLEGELPVRLLGALEGVVPGEAGVAVGLSGGANGLVHSVQGQIGQGVAVELL